MRFLPVNLNAMLVELDDLGQTLALLDALQADPVPGVLELVPAARTILVTYQPALIDRAGLIEHIAGHDISVRVERAGQLVEIPVHYDGEDLAEVAQILGITTEEVVQRHTGSQYTVAFTGFAPGFAYLTGGDPLLDVPRRKTPRTKIPAGAVGLAGTFSGIYPKASPGGWQIIGVTDTPMWDLAREVPALLQPGARVRFIDAGKRTADTTRPATQATSQTASPAPSAALAADATQPNSPAIRLRATGLQALIQDLGRPGQAGQGVSASGALDSGSLRCANRLVGNDADAACLELTYGGLEIESIGETVVAVTGADTPLTLTSRTGQSWPVANHAPLALADGDRLSLGQPAAGIRSYLAVRGGLNVAPVLGSCATDTLAQIGPPALSAGAVLPIGAHGGIVGLPDAPRPDLPRSQETVVLDVILGPRTDWFTPEAIERLRTQEWTVTPQSNRVGIRLEGEIPLTRAIERELPSEGASTGAIQVPPSGQPVLFLADHPLTGGYPIIGAVATYHLDRAGQIPVNARIRFNPVTGFDPVEAGA